MSDHIPKPLNDAQEKGIEFFENEEHEWKLEIKSSDKRIEKLVGTPVLVFANNGYGDFLFLKTSADGNGFGQEVF